MRKYRQTEHFPTFSLSAPYLLPIWSVYIYTEQIGGKQETSREKTEKQNKMKSVHTSKSKKIPIKSISLHRK
ncbi:MAG: hypothetical protein BACD_04098 [Bacteroides rodentium]